MRHTNGLVTTSEALRRVFIGVSTLTVASPIQAIAKRRPCPPQWPCRSNPVQSRSQQCCHASTSRLVTYTPSTNNAPNEPLQRGRPRRDEEIKAFKVHMVRPEDGRLTDPIPTYDVLQSRQRNEKGRLIQYLQEVAPMNAAEGRHFPVCRMFDKKLDGEKRKTDKAKKMQTKQVEVNWQMSDNDLVHRLGKLKEFLEKGWRVEVLFGVKRKGWKGRKETSQEEARRILDKVRGAVGEVEGAKEWKAMQGKEGGEMMLSYVGKAKD